MSINQNLGNLSLYSDTVGGLPEDQQTISPARSRAKWNHNLRGIQIVQIGSTFSGMEVHCIEDYLDMFVAGHTYVRSPDNNRWIDTTQKKHLHLEDTDQDGGKYTKIRKANAPHFVSMNYEPVRIGQWFTNTQGGEGLNNSGSAVLKTNNVGGNFYNIINGGHRIAFDEDIFFAYKYELITTNSRRISFRGGVNVEQVWENPTIRRCFGNQWCDDAGTDRTYQLYSSDGSENNGITTSLSANHDNDIVRAIRLDLVAKTVLKMIFEGDAVIASRANNIPRTLATSATDNIKFGLKTNENVDKQYRLRAIRLEGVLADSAGW